MVIRSKKLDKTDWLINILLYVITLGVIGTMALQLHDPAVLDEVGTMANTAFMVGYDWTECVAAMGNHYYKPGMVILYYPVFLLVKDSFMIYKLSVFINTVLISFIPVFAHIILKKHLLPLAESDEHTMLRDRIMPALIALAVGLLPSANLHSLYTKSDPMLIFLAWPITLCILEGLESSEEGLRRKNIVISVLAGFLSVYAYFAHTRGVVVIIALLMTNACMQIFTRRKPFAWIPYLASTGGFLIIERIVSGYFRNNVNIYGTKHGTLDSAGLEALKDLFGRSGFLSMVKLVIGWFYNVFAATYGMVIIGLLVTLYLIFKTFAYKKSYGTRENIPHKETAVAAFSFLNFSGSFAMGALFFFRPVHRFFISEGLGRADRVVFGRYTVCTVGPLLLIALFYLIYKTEFVGIKTRIVSVVLYLVIFLLFVFYVSPWIDGHSANTRYFISLCTFIKYPYSGGTSNTIENMCEALRLAGELAGAVFVFILVFTSGLAKKLTQDVKVCYTMVLGIIILYSVTILTVNFVNARYARDAFLTRRVSDIREVLNDVADKTDIEEKYPYVLVINSSLNIKHYQPAAMSYNFGTYKTLAAEQDNMFIIGKKNRFLAKYCDDDYYLFDDFNYSKPTCDIIYVKGAELAADLRAAGYSLTKYEGKLRSGKK